MILAIQVFSAEPIYHRCLIFILDNRLVVFGIYRRLRQIRSFLCISFVVICNRLTHMLIICYSILFLE